jgi:hypothetical protein
MYITGYLIRYVFITQFENEWLINPKWQTRLKLNISNPNDSIHFFSYSRYFNGSLIINNIKTSLLFFVMQPSIRHDFIINASISIITS